MGNTKTVVSYGFHCRCESQPTASSQAKETAKKHIKVLEKDNSVTMEQVGSTHTALHFFHCFVQHFEKLSPLFMVRDYLKEKTIKWDVLFNLISFKILETLFFHCPRFHHCKMFMLLYSPDEYNSGKLQLFETTLFSFLIIPS